MTFPKLYRLGKSQPKYRRFSIVFSSACAGLFLEWARQCCSINSTHLNPAAEILKPGRLGWLQAANYKPTACLRALNRKRIVVVCGHVTAKPEATIPRTASQKQLAFIGVARGEIFLDVVTRAPSGGVLSVQPSVNK